jgi:hypothetical protein
MSLDSASLPLKSLRLSDAEAMEWMDSVIGQQRVLSIWVSRHHFLK